MNDKRPHKYADQPVLRDQHQPRPRHRAPSPGIRSPMDRGQLKLIDEIGTHQWLERLLAVLQGAGPRNPDELAGLYDEPADE